MRSSAVLGLATTALAAPSLMDRASGNCVSTYNGEFSIRIVAAASGKRGLEARTNLVTTLKNGVLTDATGSIGDIVANGQFQYDPAPGQPHAITDGFSVCTEGGIQFLAHEGGNTVWKRCLSGKFYNLYADNNAAQCEEIKFQVVGANGAVGQAADGQVTQISDGQPQATGAAVTQIGDGQPQGPTGTVPVITQISDGQLQAPTAVVTQIADGQLQAPSGGVVSQIGDGQVQAPTGVVSQISDGQVQAPTGVVSQISDGQVQAPTGVVSQISDGQVQAPTGVVTQIGDGQVQAPTGVVTQIGDGQLQAPTGAAATPTPPPTAAGANIAASFGMVLAAAGAVLAL